jgi:enoyl-CoA hydratase
MNIERSGEVAVLRMNAGKANAIGPAFLQQLGAQLDALGDARALVITGYQAFFSAGLDLPALLALDQDQMSAFIASFGASMLRVFELPLPVVAAVNGHAVAGGCVLAVQCDHRMMADTNGRIGLKEVALGIGLPPVVVETLRSQVRPRPWHPSRSRRACCCRARRSRWAWCTRWCRPPSSRSARWPRRASWPRCPPTRSGR